MITITFDGNSEAGRTLINVARALKQTAKNTVIRIDYADVTGEDVDNLTSQHIPGLPYTHEECMESLRQAEEDIVEGRTVAWDDFKKEMATW